MLVAVDTIEPQKVQFRGVTLDVRFKAGKGDALVVLFHGALNRTRHAVPYLQRFLPVGCSQLSISDSRVLRTDSLSTTWYLGSEDALYFKILPEFINQVAADIRAKRKIFVGASSGGFAALLYAHLCGEGSAAVAVSPQIDLMNYNSGKSLERFRRACFPSLETANDLAREMPLQLDKLYAKGIPNLAVVLMSSLDRSHMATQLAPFLSSVSESDYQRLIAETGFWGVLGHGSSVPSTAWLPWVKLLVSEENWSSDELSLSKWKVEEVARLSAVKHSRSLHETPSKEGKDLVIPASDIGLAAILREYQLREGGQR
jgi:hypothetical protein